MTTRFDDVCLACRAGRHDECTLGFTGELDVLPCCCNGEYDVRLHLVEMAKADQELYGDALDDDRAVGKKSKVTLTVEAVEQPKKGDSGYIHPDAWTSARDIGTFKDVNSTGHKRAKEMYPITGGQVCEWANLKNCGGGVHPIVGCMGNPASDIHHGPDKNTLNNEKGSRGVGVAENVHIICSPCHNLFHSRNDPDYPPYDRDEQQTQPWLPFSDEPWGPHAPEPATFEELLEEEKRRRAAGTRQGRNSQPRATPDLTVREDDDEA